MATLVMLDRDGTVNEDHNNYLGSSENWKEEVKFLPGVVEGIRLINHIPGLETFILTNQAGVALGKFDEKRMHEVNEYIVDELKRNGATVRGYFACPFVDSKYVEKAKSRGQEVDQKYLDNDCKDMKPSTGMIEKAAMSLGLKKYQYDVYVIGDRKSDIEMAIRAEGTGILIPSLKTYELGDVNSVNKLKEKVYGIHIMKNFFDAAEYIYTKHFSSE